MPFVICTLWSRLNELDYGNFVNLSGAVLIPCHCRDGPGKQGRPSSKAGFGGRGLVAATSIMQPFSVTELDRALQSLKNLAGDSWQAVDEQALRELLSQSAHRSVRNAFARLQLML
jgi:hypothetical protein